VLRDHPELAAVGRLTLLQSLRCVRMVLWDERKRRLISFREMYILTSVMNRRTAAVPTQA
jgi:acyl-lipid omega-6 desaturase (Delta-12 desaturase)